MAQRQQLTQAETEFVKALYFLTGREDSIEPLQHSQVSCLRATIPAAQAHDLKANAKCDLVNRILLTLVIPPMTHEFFEVVWRNVHLDSSDQMKNAVDRFRTLCMLEHGNFRYGYRVYNQNTLALRQSWAHHFPDAEEETRRLDELKNRPKLEGLTAIPQDRLFALGYIAYESAPQITAARRKVRPILEEAARTRVADWRGLVSIGRGKGLNVGPLIEQAALPDISLLVGGESFLGKAGRKFGEVLDKVIEACVPLNKKDIKSVQQFGLQNTATYLALHDLDVYVATSMREPVHFTSNNLFVLDLFHKGVLADYRIRYFDPTQSYMDNRIQKGLLECLMIKRASLTVYNAQEGDTFGKDSELGVTLAQRKPAVVYVSRFFCDHIGTSEIYDVIDKAVLMEKRDFVDAAVSKNLIDKAQAGQLIVPERNKGDVIRSIVMNAMGKVLESIPEEEIRGELLKHGYATAIAGQTPKDVCLTKIALLERRAITFKDVHPLSLQTSPLDGVARGVYVTRTVEQTASLVRALLVGSVAYKLTDDDYNWLLCESTTGSPVRVVTKNKYLTAAFWSEKWGWAPR